MIKNIVLILGAQGSGKTTQGKLLAESLHYKFISTGEILREARESKNPLGLKLSEYWEKGDLVPDELIESILFPILEDFDVPGFVIDGYPRNLNQLESFISFLDLNAWPLIDAVYLEISREECFARIRKRAQIEMRPDENDEAVAHRLDIYYHETQPLLTKYSEMGKLLKIDGHPSPDEIHKNIVEIVNTKTKLHADD